MGPIASWNLGGSLVSAPALTPIVEENCLLEETNEATRGKLLAVNTDLALNIWVLTV